MFGGSFPCYLLFSSKEKMILFSKTSLETTFTLVSILVGYEGDRQTDEEKEDDGRSCQAILAVSWYTLIIHPDLLH